MCWWLLFCYALAPLYSCFLFLLHPIYSFVLPVLACFIVNTTSLSLPAPCFLVPAHFHFCLIGLIHTCSGLSNQAHLVVISSSARCPFSPHAGLILLRTQCWCWKKVLQHWLPINLLYLYSTFRGSQSVARLDKNIHFDLRRIKHVK